MPKDFAAMERGRPSGDTAARTALRSRSTRPTMLWPDEVQPNPANPRYADDDPEVVELAETFKSATQLQPATIVPLDLYVQLFPEREAQLGPEPWVTMIGNRRWVAARLAGCQLKVQVADDVSSAAAFKDRVLIENIHRKALPPLLEAAELRERLDRPGETLRSVGEAIGKSHTYVQQRLDLLRMVPELQDLLRTGAINVKIGRKLGTRPVKEQKALVAALADLIDEFTELFHSGGLDVYAAAEIGSLAREEQIELFAGGPPYTREQAGGPGTDAATSLRGNPVSTENGAGAGGTPEDPGTADEPAERPAAAAAAGNPVSTDDEPGADADQVSRPATAQPEAGESATTEPVHAPAAASDGRVSEDQGFDAALETTRTAVTEQLDSVLARLDHVLPAGGDGRLGKSLADARQHVERALAALRPAPARQNSPRSP